jgi:hypothetical protein
MLTFTYFLDTFTFWEACFHKIKGREILSKSPKALNTTDNNLGLTGNLTTSIKLHNACARIYKFAFEISFIYLLFLMALG